MKLEDQIFLEKSDLNYSGQSVGIVVTREYFFRLNKWDGRFLYERIGPKRFELLQIKECGRIYDEKMSNKYGKGWRQNRWLIEEVRITTN